MKSIISRATVFLAIATFVTVADARAQQPQRPAVPPCTTAEYKQFDYWIGEWDVYGPNNTKIGTNKITRIASGCALLEQWVDGRGQAGNSINFYDAQNKQWHQVWVGGDGVALRLSGNPSDGAMELAGADRNTPRGVVRDRIKWTLRPDNTVEQLWSTSTDGGVTWTAGFRGIYKRQGKG